MTTLDAARSWTAVDADQRTWRRLDKTGQPTDGDDVAAVHVRIPEGGHATGRTIAWAYQLPPDANGDILWEVRLVDRRARVWGTAPLISAQPSRAATEEFLATVTTWAAAVPRW